MSKKLSIFLVCFCGTLGILLAYNSQHNKWFLFLSFLFGIVGLVLAYTQIIAKDKNPKWF